MERPPKSLGTRSAAPLPQGGATAGPPCVARAAGAPHPRIETILLGERVDLGNPAVPRRAAHLVAVLLECLELRVLRDMPILTFRLGLL